ncbi:hypothetical protein [Phaffia rhodozyma]|uniref:Uncharacterized protein n=1 Tax=Phaffia rhodozyma TaxID=264483 RepID=A0A0F7SJU6_PHARH|nr:hypothetical protein [Phaffia rhodozyma]
MFCPPPQRHHFPEPASGPASASEHPLAHTPTQHQQQHHANVALPPTLREILDAFSKDGNGDRELLLAILGAKKAEEDRLASQLACQSQLFILSQQYAQAQAQAQAQALYYHQYQQLCVAESSAQQMHSYARPNGEARQLADSTRFNPYRRPSSLSDSGCSSQPAPFAFASASAGPISFRTNKLARIHSTLRSRRRSSSSVSAMSLSTEIPAVSTTVTAPSPSPSTRVTPPPTNPRTPPAMSSSVSKRVSLTDLLSSSSESKKPATRESFVRGTPTDGEPMEDDDDDDDDE